MLAGKRVSPKWVRKTLSCERLEDCQRECSEERRFICEGFNYRLDPTGRGQGNCELIEVPLSEMDLYSSVHNRDSNLLNHPDYDYFERDRNNSPSCRIPSPCTDCGSKPPTTSIDYYRPQPQPPSGGYGGDTGGYNKPSFVEPPPQSYGPYPIMPAVGSSSLSSSSGGYQSSGGWVQNRYDRFENNGGGDYYRPSNHYEFHPSAGQSYRPPPPPPIVDRYDYAPRPGPVGNYETDIRPDYRPPQEPTDFYGGGAGGGGYRPQRPSYPTEEFNRFPRPGYNNIDRGDQGGYVPTKPPTSNYIPYLIGQSSSYGSSSNSEQHNKYSVNYWGLKGGDDHRKEGGSNFNYYELGAGSKYHNVPPENSVWNYPGSRYGGHGQESGSIQENNNYNHINHSTQWTRRPGAEGKRERERWALILNLIIFSCLDCSAKSSEGFRLHKGVVRFTLSVPTVTECERMCSSMDNFKCFTYSYRYSGGPGAQNCLLCDRPYNSLDYYADIEPDRNYDIYSMSDDLQVCRQPPKDDRQNNARELGMIVLYSPGRLMMITTILTRR